jgi:hypothetical protein
MPRDSRGCPTAPVGPKPLKNTKSREMRGGVLYTNCGFNKTNGLQHNCNRTQCHGRSECLTKSSMCILSVGPGYISPCYPVCKQFALTRLASNNWKKSVVFISLLGYISGIQPGVRVPTGVREDILGST